MLCGETALVYSTNLPAGFYFSRKNQTLKILAVGAPPIRTKDHS